MVARKRNVLKTKGLHLPPMRKTVVALWWHWWQIRMQSSILEPLTFLVVSLSVAGSVVSVEFVVYVQLPHPDVVVGPIVSFLLSDFRDRWEFP